MAVKLLILLFGVAAVAALPYDPVITKLNPEGLRYEYIRADDGTPHLVDSWLKVSDFAAASRYNPDTDNEYHLYTRSNAFVSQPIVYGNTQLLQSTNFDPNKRTIVMIHGFLGNILVGFNTVLVPAFLAAGNVNVIVVDWGAGAHFGFNGISSGRSVGRFISWLASVSGARTADFHICGYSVGAHSAGIVGRTLLGHVGYITALDPADRWIGSQRVQPSDAGYVEVIHTDAGNIGQVNPAGHVDFYPNGGENMPGCSTSYCNHYRSYFYMAESLTTGGFTGTECASLADALAGTCNGSRTLPMGGLIPKTGSSGIYHMITNAAPPFSRG